MDSQYNIRRYNRRKQLYRFSLGAQQLIIHPIWNLIWILFAVAVVFFKIGERKLLSNFTMYPLLMPLFNGCVKFIMVFLPVMCAIGIVQLIGTITAVKDEADLGIVFGDRRDANVQLPILIYKRKIRKKGVIVREFYSTIPMERWQERKEALCDIMNVHLIGDIEYGDKSNGNRIVIKTAKGRKLLNRGVLYDDTF